MVRLLTRLVDSIGGTGVGLCAGRSARYLVHLVPGTFNARCADETLLASRFQRDRGIHLGEPGLISRGPTTTGAETRRHGTLHRFERFQHACGKDGAVSVVYLAERLPRCDG